MPTHRDRFYSSLRQMRNLASNALLIDKLPVSDAHNIRARILRHGLTVSAFSSLEKYIEARVGVITSALPASGLNFIDFGDDLRAFLTIDAVSGLANRINFTEKNYRLTYADTQLQQLSQYAAVPPAYTALGFSPRGSNVSEADVSNVLKAFGVANPWAKMSSIAGLVGSARLDLKADYQALSRARHRSAHNPDSNVASGDLVTHIENATLIAVTFDVVTSMIARSIPGLPNFAALPVRVAAAVPAIRFVDKEPNGSWAERPSSSARTVKRYPSEAAAVAGAKGRANTDLVISRDVQRVPVSVG